jgi:YbbR domain-containing protein
VNKINKDRWIFIGCVVVATTFWAMQKLSNNYKFIQRYSVRYTIPNGKVFKRQPTSTVEVTLVGLGWDIVTKSAKNIGDKIEVELSADNNQLIPSSAIAEKINSLLASNEISVSQIKPSNINILLEDQANKKVPVVSKMNIEFLPGFFIKNEIRFTPDSVVLTGSQQQLKDINQWNTEIVYISKLNKNIVEMPVALESPKSEMLRLDESMVRMNLEVEEYTEKIFTVPLRVKNSDSKVKSIPNKVEVRCVVGLSKFDLLTEEDVELYINLDESLIKRNVNIAPISISRLPSFVRHISYEPAAAKFFVLK